MERALGLERQGDAAGHDQQRADQHRRPGLLAEHDDGERDREERGDAERDRRSRRARLPDGHGDEEVREAGGDRAGEEERQETVERDAALDRSGHAEDGEGRHLHEERGDGGGHEWRNEREAHGDRHRAEERGRDERERDGVH